MRLGFLKGGEGHNRFVEVIPLPHSTWTCCDRNLPDGLQADVVLFHEGYPSKQVRARVRVRVTP